MGTLAYVPFVAPGLTKDYSETLITPLKESNTLNVNGEHEFNGSYSGRFLDRIAFPIGGIGAGMFCMEGTGSISHLSVHHHPEIFNEPFAFAALSVKGNKNGTKVIEAPVPQWKLFGQRGSGNGASGKNYGLPRFNSGTFLPRFPFGNLQLFDDDIPLIVQITGWSPFIPTDEDNSSLPVGALEYRFENPLTETVEAVFSYNARNFIDDQGRILTAKNGFRLVESNMAAGQAGNGFVIYVDSDEAKVDYCWFRGGWFDPLTMLWRNISELNVVTNPPFEGASPGASIYVPFSLEPGESKTITVNFCWYFPQSDLSSGSSGMTGPAFQDRASRGTARGQQTVSGFSGRQLVNTFDPSGDGQTGVLQSPPMRISKRYLKFLIGGGKDASKVGVRILIDGNVVYTIAGNDSERLVSHIWDLQEFFNKDAFIQIFDHSSEPWGHILCDQFVLTDNLNEDLNHLSSNSILVASFEDNNYGDWVKLDNERNTNEQIQYDPFYKPWYSGKFKSIDELVFYWNQNYKNLRHKSELFSEAFFRTTLPPEVMEAIAANLTILKSPTILRQADGKLWAWEGCGDNSGCCAGSCTHVWNYAQAIPHLFPSLERSLRETEFEVNQDRSGHQVFRANLPISNPVHNFHSAADGQLGGIMKVYREWRISGDSAWMRALYPKVKESMDYCIETWDPKHKGCVEEPHHNTYDIEFWGPNGMICSFYLGALKAFIEMSKFLNHDHDFYSELLVNGTKYMEKELFDGEYFIQKIVWQGLNAQNPMQTQSFHSSYSPEAQLILEREGPKYQYGTGCLSDGVLGMWIASVCGLSESLDNKKVTSHLNSIYKYNLARDLRDHYNPQRPSYACGNEGGLLLCTWPKGGKLSLPFVYSNEVWTGIEYQVASHLMFKGEIEKGCDIVRVCRQRYDGSVRNPFNEYECGHWYARAMASYGMLQSLTGVWFDAVEKILYIDSRIGDFESFLSIETGFGNIGLKNGEPYVNIKYGELDCRKVLVSGTEKQLHTISG